MATASNPFGSPLARRNKMIQAGGFRAPQPPPTQTGPGTAAPVPSWPAPSSFDPTIQLNADAANRGLGDTLSDYVTNYGEPGTALGGRQGYDYQTQRALTQRSSDRSLADLMTASTRAGEDFTTQRGDVNTQYGRSLADLLTQRQQGTEDYQTSLADLARNYTRLAGQQAQAARQAGVSHGGVGAQSARKRAENQAHDKAPIDTGYNRFLAGSQLSQSRLGEDQSRALSGIQTAQDRFNQDNSLARTRLGEDTATQLGGLDTQYLRGGEDAATQLARAIRENQYFQLGSRQQAIYQAGPPAVPVKKKKK